MQKCIKTKLNLNIPTTHNHRKVDFLLFLWNHIARAGITEQGGSRENCFCSTQKVYRMVRTQIARSVLCPNSTQGLETLPGITEHKNWMGP